MLWCSVINYGLLLVWFGFAVLGRGWLYRYWARWFPIPKEQFDAINLAGIILYKCGTLLFNVVPCIALYLVR